MGRDICEICGWDNLLDPVISRTAHLVCEHRMETQKRMVSRNFIRHHEVTPDDRQRWLEYHTYKQTKPGVSV